MNRTQLRSQPTPLSATAGFTLIEVFVVVFIIAILAAIAAPGWLAYVNRQRMRAVQSDLAQILRQAQTEAVQTRSDRTVDIPPGTTLEVTNANGLTQSLGSDDIPDGALEIQTPADSSISFDYRGNPPANSVPFVVSVTTVGAPATATRRCVIVGNLLGSVKTANDADCNNITAATLDSDLN